MFRWFIASIHFLLLSRPFKLPGLILHHFDKQLPRRLSACQVLLGLPRTFLCERVLFEDIDFECVGRDQLEEFVRVIGYLIGSNDVIVHSALEQRK